MDVPTLVSQMNETLSTIHSTIASLNTTAHDARLDDLERQRDLAISSLNAAFAQETEALSRQRGAERDEIVERRRREDEERERRRREEDEELAEAQRKEDEERRGRLDGEAKGVEEETDEMMGSVEDEAQRMLEEGKEKLRALEEKRKELNRLIDEQLKMPLPSAPTRRRSTRTGAYAPPVVAAESKPQAPALAVDEHIGNLDVKAPKENPGGPNGDVSWAWEQLAPGSGPREGVTIPEPAADEHAETGNPRGAYTEPAREAASVVGDAAAAQDVPQPEQAEEQDLQNDKSNLTEVSASEDPAPRPKSLFGSWGKTMRNLVVSQPDSKGTQPKDQETGTNGDLSISREESTPGSYPVEEITPVNDAFGSVPESPSKVEAPHGEVLNGEPVEHERAIMDPDVELATDTVHNAEIIDVDVQHADEILEDGSKPNDPLETETVSTEEDLQATPVLETDGGEEPAGLEEDSLPNQTTVDEEIYHHDEQFDMTGNEAIPGTITHGSSDLEKDTVEAIPGTMTHGSDSPTLDAEVEGTILPDVSHHEIDNGSSGASAAPSNSEGVDHAVEAEPEAPEPSIHIVLANDGADVVEGETLDSITEAAPRSPQIYEPQHVESADDSLPIDDQAIHHSGETETPNSGEAVSADELAGRETHDVAEVINPVEDNSSIEKTATSDSEPNPMPETAAQDIPESAVHPARDADNDASLPDSKEDTQEVSVLSQSEVVEEEPCPMEVEENATPAELKTPRELASSPDQEDSPSVDDTPSLPVSSETPETPLDQDTSIESISPPTVDPAPVEQDEPIKAPSEIEAEPNPEPEEPTNPPGTDDNKDDIAQEHHGSDTVQADDQPRNSSTWFREAEINNVPSSPEAPQPSDQDLEHALGETDSNIADGGEEEVASQVLEHVRVDQEPRPMSAEEVGEVVASEPETDSVKIEQYHPGEGDAGQVPTPEQHDFEEETEQHLTDTQQHEEESDSEGEEDGHVEATQQDASPQNLRDGHDPEEMREAISAEPIHEETIPTPGDAYEFSERENQLHISGHGQDEGYYQSLLESYEDHCSLKQPESNADSGSQPFVTPLASAGFRSPLTFEDARSSAGLEDGQAEDTGEEYEPENYHSSVEDEHSQADEANSQYELEHDYSTTVHGQDDLFEDNSDESEEIAEEPLEEVAEQVAEEAAEGAAAGIAEDATQEVVATEEDGEPEVLGAGDSSVKEQIITSDVPHLDDDDEPRTAVPVDVEQPTGDSRYVLDDEEHDVVPAQDYSHEPTHLEEPTHSDEPAYSGSDSIAVESQPSADWLSHEPDSEEPTIERASTPPLRPTEAPVTPDAKLSKLPQRTPVRTGGGLANSRHNPDRPRTPPQADIDRHAVDEESEAFVPRDVTNIPWHSRTESFPQSLHSQSTISSSPLSTTDSPLRIYAHEPAIHDGSPAYAHSQLLNGITGRPRGDSQASSSYDHYNYDTKAATAQWLRRESEGGSRSPARLRSDDDGSHQPHRNSAGPGTLFQKMRSIFEQTGATTDVTAPHLTGGATWSGRGRSPANSRPVSWAASHPAARKVGVVAGSGRDFGGGSSAEVVSDDGHNGSYKRRSEQFGQFLTRSEGESDERSSLLQNGY